MDQRGNVIMLHVYTSLSLKNLILKIKIGRFLYSFWKTGQTSTSTSVLCWVLNDIIAHVYVVLKANDVCRKVHYIQFKNHGSSAKPEIADSVLE